jgi:hypothetical protein
MKIALPRKRAEDDILYFYWACGRQHSRDGVDKINVHLATRQ